MAAELCADCGTKSPRVDSEHTLTGFGWRLHREHNAQGVLTAQWRCPKCWRKYKQVRAAAAGATAHAPEPPDTPTEAFARVRQWLRAVRKSDPPSRG